MIIVFWTFIFVCSIPLLIWLMTKPGFWFFAYYLIIAAWITVGIFGGLMHVTDPGGFVNGVVSTYWLVGFCLSLPLIIVGFCLSLPLIKCLLPKSSKKASSTPKQKNPLRDPSSSYYAPKPKSYDQALRDFVKKNNGFC